MKLSRGTRVAGVLLMGGALLTAVADLPAQQRSPSKSSSPLPVLNLRLGSEADHAFSMHGKMDIPLKFAIEGGSRSAGALQLATVTIRNGRVISIGRTTPFSPPGDSFESSIGGRTAVCCIDWCRGDGKGNWKYSRTCGNPCASDGVGLLSQPLAELPALPAARVLPRQGEDFNRFVAQQFNQRVNVQDAVLLAIVPADGAGAEAYSTKPLLLGVQKQPQ